MANEEVSDPLKDLDEVCRPDPRESHFPLERLPLIHAELSRLVLHDGVPVGVRQLFETAKNAALYTYFVYRFHQVAEMVAHSALELALKIKDERPDRELGPGLAKLLRKAIDEGWIAKEGFPSRDPAARERVRNRKGIALWAANPNAEVLEIPEPTLEEIAAETRPFDFVSALLGTIGPDGKRSGGIVDHRNTLAHGSRLLYPGSRTTLRLVAETINQLFAPKGAPA